MAEYYDREGKPLTLREFAERFEDLDYQRVAFDKVGDAEVSTVWLGIDHGFGKWQPLIFETMIFGGEDEEQYRYSTEDEARAGHARIVAQLQGE